MGSCALSYFWEITANISETVQDKGLYIITTEDQ